MSNVKLEIVGFVIIACGPFAHSLKAEAFIESLVKHGKWNRKIFIITDLPNCFDVDWIRRVAGSSNRVLGPKAPTMIGHITLRRLLAEGKQFYEQQVAGLGLKSCEPGYYNMPLLPGWVIAL